MSSETVSGAHISSSDSNRQICKPEHRRKCELGNRLKCLFQPKRSFFQLHRESPIVRSYGTIFLICFFNIKRIHKKYTIEILSGGRQLIMWRLQYTFSGGSHRFIRWSG